MAAPPRRPLIGITTDLAEDRFVAGSAYARGVAQAGGLPIILPCIPDLAAAFVDRCDGVILTGGDDPRMETWGHTTHPSAKPLHPDRQAFELAILAALDEASRKPALGVCLGMQLMGLHAGGTLDQYLPDTLPTAGDHWGRKTHEIAGTLGRGSVLSHHRQALTSPGSMRIAASAPDGIIEAVQRDDRPFYLGVQWHPERTDDPNLGAGIIAKLVEAAKMSAQC